MATLAAGPNVSVGKGMGKGMQQEGLQSSGHRAAEPAPAPRLDALPREAMARVLSYLTFEEICHLRGTCRAVARAAEEVLVRAFDAFGARLLRRLRDLRLSVDFSFHTCLICKTLYLIEIEYRLLRAAVGVYVRESSAPFVGGRILDMLEHALALSTPPFPMPDEGDVAPPPATGVRQFNNMFAPDIVDELSRLVERYICFFEREVEPRLRQPTPLGVKLVDVFDAFTGACSDVELRTQGGWRSLRARYHLPLTGLLFHDEDTGPCTRVTVPESESASLLAALREAARKSGQRYVSALLQRELAGAESRRAGAHYGLFGVRRRCVARDRLSATPAASAAPASSPATPVGGVAASKSGSVGAFPSGCSANASILRERLERRPLRLQPPVERDGASPGDIMCLRAALRLRFWLNQRPLEADCLGVPMDEDKGLDCPADPGRWGWDEDGGQGAPPPPLPFPEGPAELDEPRTCFWFQLEVHRLPPDSSPNLDGPVPALGPVVAPRRRLSFQPSRFCRLRLCANGGALTSPSMAGRPGSSGTGTSAAAAAAAASASPATTSGGPGGGGVGYIGSALSVSLRDVCVTYALPMPPRPCEARICVTYGRLRRTSASDMDEGIPDAAAPSTTSLDAARALGALEALEAVDAISALRSARDGEESGLAKLRSTLAAVAQPKPCLPAGDPVAAAAAVLLKDTSVDELTRRVSEVLGSEATLLNRLHRPRARPTAGGEGAAAANAMQEDWRDD